MVRMVAIIHAALVAYFIYDCYRHRREPFWYLVLLVPVWRVGLYIYRFKF